MSQTLRIPEILAMARRDGKVSVDGLAAHFGVTLQTIRRDLTDLAEAGRLVRVHGGAILPSGISNIAYEERRALNQSAKAGIARSVAQLIPNDCAIFLNIGTTTEAVAHALLHHQNLLVVTNNINVAQILSANPDCQVIVTGGALRPADGGLVGDLAARAVGQFRFDIAVIGCSALDQDGDFLDFDLQEVVVSQEGLHAARRRVLVCDHSKLSRTAPARIGALQDLDQIVTDEPAPDRLAGNCAAAGVEILVA
ncbi:DeoR/GlpR family DNA-binding transcription regulator [uncultured Aliiroseovarius sp.]|uniref:DeoR/GlpR family DNA-binding transcription regulator n=1 Tax=uncultured Aliiroseovarius sp. TaxID=1658783 RepID=UPI00259AC9A3|nr:DeoR/GlpR family DNA-binding transcription regulator [uncultured Aliiroseovarius sp.]